MDTNTAIVIAILVLAVAAVVALLAVRKRRSSQLRSHFGPEYEQALETTGDKKHAERELHAREKRVAKFQLRPLQAADRTRFVTTWTGVQAAFVDDPRAAVTNADSLLGEVMAARGYPVSDFEQRAADLSVDHPVVVQNYRAAHTIALKHQRGDAGTEDLRQAMIHYRSLFEELVDRSGSDETVVTPAVTRPQGDGHAALH